MLCPIETSDIPELRRIIEVAIRTNVTTSNQHADYLIDDVKRSLEKWEATKKQSFHLKRLDDGVITGFIIVKEFWNLSHLFVLPEFHRRGIGRTLVSAALETCRDKSPRQKIQLNSSTNAVPFYKATGFLESGPGIDRPGGCVPFEYVFPAT